MDIMKSLVPVWCYTYDALTASSKQQKYREYFSREDLHTFVRRSKNEGLAFASGILSQLANDVYASFESKQLTVTARVKVNGALPVFLNKLFLTVYTSEGRLKDAFDLRTLHILLQMLGLFKKLKGPFCDTLTEAVVNDFSAAQREELPEWAKLHGSSWNFQRARELLHEVLGICPTHFTPKHGPGQVAEKLTNAGKRARWPRWSPKLSQCFGEDHLVSSDPDNLFELISTEDFCDQDAHKVTRVDPIARCTLVPKEWGKPRLISMEPSEFQETQQGIKDAIYNRVQHCPNPAQGLVNFEEQVINRRLVTAPFHGVYATVDMKAASDRVWYSLVEYLFPADWLKVLAATRTESTILPDGTNCPLSCFAPMGSATNFPVEALIFWSLATSVAEAGTRRPVYVYGDDIIVAKEDLEELYRLFDDCRFIINSSKSYSVGAFRESCGNDVYGRRNVTVARYRVDPELGFSKPEVVAGLVGFITSFTSGFGHRAGVKLALQLEKLFDFNFHWNQTHTTAISVPLSHPYDPYQVVKDVRWNTDLQIWEYAVSMLVVISSKDKITKDMTELGRYWDTLRDLKRSRPVHPLDYLVASQPGDIHSVRPTQRIRLRWIDSRLFD